MNAGRGKRIRLLFRCLVGRAFGKMRKREAEEYISRGMKILNELDIKPSYSWGLLFLGELYADAGRKEKALGILEKAETLFQEMGMNYWLDRNRIFLAKL